MGLSSSLENLLLPLWISWICAGLAAPELVHEENCTNYELQFERVFSVPGDVAMLKSTLLPPDVFNFTTAPFSITWYSKKTRQEMRNETGQVLVLRETLWFLNTTMDDAGEYLTVLRTPSQCYMQSTKLVVELPVAGECGRPQKVEQHLTEGVADTLTCPLSDYIDKLDSYGISSSVSWYKGCYPILDDSGSHAFRDRTKMMIHRVKTENYGSYTCILTFTLDGVNRSVSETINASVKDDISLVPQVHEPENAIIKATKGMNFTKRCLVFVPGAGMPFVDVVWLVRNKFIRTTQPSERIYISEQRLWTQDDPKGVWLERLLLFSELRREDFYLNYTCRAHSSRRISYGYFTLLPTENCTNYKLQFERVFSIPGDVAMLNSTLLSPDVFNFTTVPFSITWYNKKTGQEMRNETGQVLVLRETLWFLNTTMDDAGEYLTVLRTPSQCYMQSTKLVVELPVAGECGRPQKVEQHLTEGVADTLTCPLSDYIDKLDSYGISSSVSWYKGCDPILDDSGSHAFRDRTKMTIYRVKTENSDSYTCILTFKLDGVNRSVSETIDASVKDGISLVPQIHEPENEIIKATIGMNFTKRCLVFVPGAGMPFVDVVWLVRNKFIRTTQPSERIYISEQRLWTQDDRKGVWLERLLLFSELRGEDFYLNYTCRAHSSRGYPDGYFTLLPTDPNVILPIGLVAVGVTVLFIISVTIYYIFRIDIVLWFRRTFPVLYTNKDLDGRLYDAYVACPNPGAFGFNEEVEKFALQTLPEVLEQACGYKLFIAGRDCLPGQAIMESVDENLQASRRVLLLYTASTFISKRHTSSTSGNNNNITKISEGSEPIESSTNESTSNVDFDGGDKVFLDTRQQLECMAAMSKALLEGSIKVVLVELEEITPAQLALFPESVLHLRKKQGAVCWWKAFRTTQRWRTSWSRREDEEKGGKDSKMSPSLSPSSRFWKEIRYHMPVRGKRVIYPEKTALLHL
ncbi:interleukin-1 receptor-like 2 isoform 1-T3 [Fundulus diaphanus]